MQDNKNTFGISTKTMKQLTLRGVGGSLANVPFLFMDSFPDWLLHIDAIFILALFLYVADIEKREDRKEEERTKLHTIKSQ